MTFLFFLVHPSKFHLFRNTINILKQKGNNVDLAITSKDVLEELVKEEGWDYTNVFPEGRKIKWLLAKLSAGINLFRTLYRLRKYIGDKKYDLFITDDLLTFIGKIKKVPTFLFQDDDITAVPESRILLATADYLIAPNCADFKRYNDKKIGFSGFKASAYLHPNHFKPDITIFKKYIPNDCKLFIIRTVHLASTHDVGKQGLSNEILKYLINIFEKYGKVVISSERQIPEELERYKMPILAKEFMHLMAYADLFISDSQTMSLEAGYLGTPYIRFNDFVGKINYLEEMENKYSLGYGISTSETDLLFEKVKELVALKDLKKEWQNRRKKMLSETIDLSAAMVWLFENYPESIKELEHNPQYLERFK